MDAQLKQKANYDTIERMQRTASAVLDRWQNE